MKLEIKKSDKDIISSISFKNASIAEIVTFWTNVKHTSPQFPLDLTPNVLQEDDLYPKGEIPMAELAYGIEFVVTNGEEEKPFDNLQIIQVKLNFIGNELKSIPGEPEWKQYFNTDSEKFVYAPDGSAYISPKNSPNSVQLDKGEGQENTEYYFSTTY